MFTYGLAYRHLNGDVEGFMGFGFSEASAKRDSENQILRKLSSLQVPESFEPKNVISTENVLSVDEMENVRRDWKTDVRY